MTTATWDRTAGQTDLFVDLQVARDVGGPVVRYRQPDVDRDQLLRRLLREDGYGWRQLTRNSARVSFTLNFFCGMS